MNVYITLLNCIERRLEMTHFNKFKNYFNTSQHGDFERNTYDILPQNTMIEYISNTFLNGFINYVTPIKGYVLNRYVDWYKSENNAILIRTTSKTVQNQDPRIFKTEQCYVDELPGYENEHWHYYTFKNKKNILDIFNEDPALCCHTDLSMFNDDIVILAKRKIDNLPPEYWFFYFDCDPSDCHIGRFLTNDSEEEIVVNFSECINNLDFSNEELYLDNNKIDERAKELNITHLNGWIKF